MRCSTPAARADQLDPRSGRPGPAPTARCARARTWSARSACSTSIQAAISSVSAIPASCPQAPEPITDRANVGVTQGFVEESNVNPVLEMTRLIMVQRAFENVAALMRQTAASSDDAIKTLGSK